MSNKILVFLLPFLLSANLAQALTCKSGDSACATNSAAECEKLGYAKTVAGCSHYLYCPFDTAYKTCSSTSSVATACAGYQLSSCPTNGICESCPASGAYKKLTSCNSGYTLNSAGDGCVAATCSSGYAKTVAGCGTTGDSGWSLGTKDANGCGKCTAKACPDDSSTEITSEEDCNKKYGNLGHDGYDKYGFSGDKQCGYCRGFQDCNAAGFVEHSNSGSDCDYVPVYYGQGIILDCYDCSGSSSGGSGSGSGSGSGGNTLLDDCIEGCNDDCHQNIKDCAGYSACVNNCHVRFGY